MPFVPGLEAISSEDAGRTGPVKFNGLERLGFVRSLFGYDFAAKRRPEARELLAMKLKVPAPVGIQLAFGIKSLRVIQQTIVRISKRPEAWGGSQLV